MAGAAALEIEIAPPVSRSDTCRILVVDDDPATRAAVCSWFHRQPDVEIFDFSSAEEVLNETGSDGYHLCLLDARLTGVNGIMLGAMIRALNPAARMVLLTAAPAPQLERQAFEHGFEAVIPKPIREHDLLRLVGGEATGLNSKFEIRSSKT
jgi:CheY-like chemotaxis protein